MRPFHIAAAAAVLTMLAMPAMAANFEVHMLNKGEAGAMVFEPALTKVAVGDTVTFVPTDKSHDAESIKGLIPADATARVGLPRWEGATFEVGAGRHAWSYPYQVPEVVYPTLTLDSKLGEVIEKPAAYAAVMNVVTAHNAEFADRLNGQTEVTLREALLLHPNPERLTEKIAAALAASD